MNTFENLQNCIATSPGCCKRMLASHSFLYKWYFISHQYFI